MLKICDLAFKENAILTKEMLSQMNLEPKWLMMTEKFREITLGVIGGFSFRNGGVDEDSILTRGNVIIDGKWFRMDDDYHFDNSRLESGKFYNIYLKKESGEMYDIVVSDEDSVHDGMRIAYFKYDSRSHNRTFRVPETIEDLSPQSRDAFVTILIPYYNSAGIAVCPEYLSACLKNELLKKPDKRAEEEIILQFILNNGTVSVSGLRSLIGCKAVSDRKLTDEDFEMIIRWASGASEVRNNNTDTEKRYDEGETGRRTTRGF